MFGYLGWAMVIAVSVAVDTKYGPIGETRLFGLYFVLASAYFIFVSELPIQLGRQRVAALSRWQKGFSFLLCMNFGCLWIYDAAEITCVAARYRHLCA